MNTRSLLPLLLGLLLLPGLPSQAGTVTVTNNTGASTQSVVDNAGNIVTDGFAAIGTIPDPALPTLFSGGNDLASIFNVFGSPGRIGSTTGLIALNGVYNIQASADFSDPATAERGQPIYLVLGNGTDLSSSSQVGLLRVGMFPTAEPSLLTINVDQGAEVIFGDYDRFRVSPGSAFGNPIDPAPAFSFFVPEPTSSLLVGVALLSALARRRR